MKVLYLQRGKEGPIRRMNHWIFSGAIKKFPENFDNGEIVQVRSNDNKVLGHGYFNDQTSLAGRMINFSEEDPLVSLRQNIKSAFELRKKLFNVDETNCYRVINGEADYVPGLIVDKYADVLVIQIGTLGLEKLKNKIIKMLAEISGDEIRMIYEKSNMPSRKQEGLENSEKILWTKDKNHNLKTTVMENGIKFEIDFEHSHKTGFYLDQREMRSLIGSLSKGKSILNCFSYTGGFSIYAAKNGAQTVTSVDISSEVIDQARRNFALNNIPLDFHEFVSQDVFKFFDNQKEFDYDIVILDPPAFAKKKGDVEAALSGYGKLNYSALTKMKKGSLLLTCSCSYHVDEEAFLRMLSTAASRAKRNIKIMQTHRHAMDHVINVHHRDMDYLKGFLCYVE